MTTALYRRYRPESFAEVIGQDHVTAPLRQALRTGQVNHAYLFSGPRGCGKTTSARILARILNCAQNTPENPTDTPCGTCPSCVELARGGPGSLDVVEIDAASHGGVDDARELRERATFAPARDRYKVFILDEAHMVTTQGFNALLKIVEEPPPHVKFIFATTEPDKVIGTIRSRTHHYPFRLVPPDVLVPYLDQLCATEGVPVGSGVLPLVVRAGAGSVRDTLSVLDQLIAGADANGLEYEGAAALLGYTPAALLDDLVEAIAARDGASAFRVVERVISTGHEPRRFVEDLLERLRDLIVIAASGDAADAALRDVPADQMARMRLQAANLGPSELSRSADLANAALTEMTGATSPRLHLELLMARLLLPAADDSRSGLGARLDRLERGLPAGAAAPTRSAADAEASSAPADVPRPAPVPASVRPARPGTAPAERTPAPLAVGPLTVTPARADEVTPAAASAGATPPAESSPAASTPAAARSGSGPVAPTPVTTPSGSSPVAPTTGDTPSASSPAVPSPGATPSESSPVAPTTGVTPSASSPAPLGATPSESSPVAPTTGDTPSGSSPAVPSPAATPSAGAAPAPDAADEPRPAEPADDARPEPGGVPTPAARSERDAVPTPEAGPARDAVTAPAPGRSDEAAPAPAAPDDRVEQASAAEQPAPAAAVASAPVAPATPPAGGQDTEMLRRRWPEVLETVKGLRRVTWALVDPRNAQVAELDATTLRLAFSTTQLAATFRNGAHADVVQRAVRETLGFDVRVEGTVGDVSPTAATPAARSMPPAPAPAPGPGAGPGARPAGPTSAPGAVSPAQAAASWDDEPPLPEPPDDEPPAPHDDDPADAGPSAATAGPSARERGMAAAARQSAARASVSNEPDEPSPDDPDITSSGLVGAPLVAQMLGGTVIDEQIDDTNG